MIRKEKSKDINRCFDCPKATFRTRHVCICGAAKDMGAVDKMRVSSHEVSPTCPLGVGQPTKKKKGNK